MIARPSCLKTWTYLNHGVKLKIYVECFESIQKREKWENIERVNFVFSSCIKWTFKHLSLFELINSSIWRNVL